MKTDHLAPRQNLVWVDDCEAASLGAVRFSWTLGAQGGFFELAHPMQIRLLALHYVIEIAGYESIR